MASNFKSLLFINAIFCVALFSTSLFAQGTPEDYQRSVEITQQYRRAYRANFPAYRWHKDGILLTSKTAAEKLRFVDGPTGKESEASTLSKLGLSNEQFDLQPRATWDRSKGGGSKSSITFKNTFDRPVRLFWSDMRRNLKPFGEIAPGEEKTISTYDRHVWVADFAANDLAGIFSATSGPCKANIDKESQRIAMQESENQPLIVPPIQRLKIREHNVWIIDKKGNSNQLTKNGSAKDSYARQIQYSPDGKYAFVFQATKVEKRQIPLVESTPKDQVQPKIKWIDYVKPGDELSQRRPKLFDLQKGQQVEVNEEPFLDSWSVRFQGWSEDASKAYFLYNQRGHQRLSLESVRVADGKVETVINETSETFVDYSQKTVLQWLNDKREILWASERDGWNHLYRINAETGEVINQVTQGEWVMRKIEFIDHENETIWFTAMGIRPAQDPYHRHLARINFDGTGLVVLTESDGDHEWELNPEKTLLLARWSRVDQPETWELRNATDGSLVKKLYQQDVEKLETAGFNIPIRFSAPGRDGKTMIYGYLIRPSNFDPEKRYPVIENVYAGPHDFHVPKQFGLQISNRRISELGFVIAKIDGMGTNWRSKKFHDVCWKNLADGGFPDRIAWLKAAAKKYDWLDLNRVGIYGGSAGGQNALAALLNHGDFYKAAVSDCGCHDNRMDKIWWNEAWMGKVGPHYEKNSNVTLAKKLKGKLLLTVGELDSNVDPASTMQVVDSLIKANKDFDFVMVPGAGHGIGESKYLFRRRQDFFVRTLLNVDPKK